MLTVINSISPHTVEQISMDNTFYRFVLEVILLCATKATRFAAAEQLFLISKHSPQRHMLNYFLSMLCSVLHTTVKECAKTSHEFFQLLCRLLNFATTSGSVLTSAESLLVNEINWIKKARVCTLVILYIFGCNLTCHCRRISFYFSGKFSG